MTNQVAINFLNQVRKIILDDKSWLESTIQPINEAFDMAINALTAQPEPCEDAVSRNAIIQKLNTMDRYVSEELRLCDTDKKFLKNEVFIVDDVYEEIVENLPSVQPEERTKERTETHACDCVSRQAAIDAMCELMHHWFGGDPKDEIREIKRELEKLPSVQPERPKGHWIFVHPLQENDSGAYMCSECRTGDWDIVPVKDKYCKFCGADMRGEKNG